MAFDAAQQIELRRDAVDAENYDEIKPSSKELEHLECLDKIIAACQESPFFSSYLSNISDN